MIRFNGDFNFIAEENLASLLRLFATSVESPFQVQQTR